MEKLILLGLIQKNFRYLQSFQKLRENLLVQLRTYEDLRAYLEAEESDFFRRFCGGLSLLKEEKEILDLISQGIKFTFPGDCNYPPRFQGMPGAPFFLSFKGHPAWLKSTCISVVGSRDASQLSHLWMEENFAEFLRQEKPVVISGGARGVDQMAHQLSLRNSCPTVVVLPSGLKNIYPQNLQSWEERIVEGGGCLLSEYMYTEKMQKHFFHDRNRLIAGLGVFTLLIEARRRSGSLLTAQKALQLGKSVLVIPGHPCDNSHLGNLDLLCEGATPIRDAQELCMYFRSELNIPLECSPMASEDERN